MGNRWRLGFLVFATNVHFFCTEDLALGWAKAGAIVAVS